MADDSPKKLGWFGWALAALLFVFAIMLGLRAGCGLSLSSTRKVSGQVMDETGAPVRDVAVRLDWCVGIGLSMNGPSQEYLTQLQTDAGGRFSGKGGAYYCGLKAMKEGYYPSMLSISPNMSIESLQILLKKIHRPQPMVGKKAWIRLPVGASILQYDLLAGDCLPPHGKGVVADLEIEWVHPENPHTEARWQAFKCRMIGVGNGVSKPLPESKPPQAISRLLSPHEAPTDGYEPEFDFASISLREQTAVRVFKIRSGESGVPLFGKMLGPVSYSADKKDDDFEFEYVINPSGERGLEMDLKRLTVPDRKRREEAPRQF